MATVTTWSQYLLLIFSILLYFGVAALTFIFMNIVQDTPYMDEEFHIAQAQKYCQGRFFEWNQKITTPPGLYLLSMGILKPLSRVFSSNMCSLFCLRFINVIFNTGNFYLIYCISRKLHQNASFQKLLVLSLNLALLPVLYFFTFLYYTDAGSLFFVLLMYLHRLYHQDLLAATFGLISLSFRQTNIVWVFFIAADRTFEIIQNQLLLDKKYSTLSKGSIQYLFTVLSFTFAMPFHQKRLFYATAVEIAKTCWGYVLVGLSFLGFLIWNHGIVLGDRDAHHTCFHLAQIFYFLGFSLCFTTDLYLTLPLTLRFVTVCMNRAGVAILFMAVVALCLHGFSYAHPYLLADNRHYAFYFWRWILGRPYLRHLLIPGYLYAGWAIMQSFQTKNSIWKALFVASVFSCVVPQELLEFRYFIIPYTILRLNHKCGSNFQLTNELFAYICLNIMSISLFAFRPFLWHNSGDVQRFMW